MKGTETICKPNWIVESIEAGKLLDYTQYLLYTHQTKQQPKISFNKVVGRNDEVINTTERLDKPTDPCSPGSKWQAKNATDSRFLGEFFNNSRLHHIATMGANAKDYVGELRAQHDGNFDARKNLTDIYNSSEHVDRTIMHIDMDCFFVSVGLRNKPELRGKPVVVTHSKGNRQSKGSEEDAAATERRKAELQQYKERLDRKAGVRSSSNWKLDTIDGTSSLSEIASCSYEARAKGVKNGMFLGPALALCPDLVCIQYDFTGYQEVSKVLYDTVASYTLDIQSVSCDEMFVDLTSLCRGNSIHPLNFVAMLRQEIESKTGCCCSVGLGPNILLSRLATKKAKPDGQVLLTMESAHQVLAELQVTDLPGVGRSMERKLAGFGVKTVSQLLELSCGKLQQEVGEKTGQMLYNMARGNDDRELELDHVRKTVSAEVNYGIRFTGWEEAENFLEQLSGEVSSRLGKIRMIGRCITLKLMVRAENAPEKTAKFNGHGVCDNISKSTRMNVASSSREVIMKEIMALVRSSSVDPKEMRGLGISMSKLEQVGSGKPGLNNSILKFVQKDVKFGKENNPPIQQLKKQNISCVSEQDEIDPEFLDSLPSDIRAEVEAQIKTSKPSKDIKGRSKNPFLKVGKKDNSDMFDYELLGPEILNQFPPDIRAEEVSRFKNGIHTSNPLQVELNDLPPGPSSRSSNVNQALNTSTELTCQFISHLELDPSVLDQLPQDIRAEVEAEYKQRSAILTPEKVKQDPIDQDVNSCDISFSQVDQNVLSELPADVQAELRKHYDRNSQSKGNKTKSAFDAIMKSSPIKNGRSPIKISKGKRGRKKGSVKLSKGVVSGNIKSPKKLVIIELDNNLDIEDNNSVDMEVLNALPESIRVEVEAQMKSNEAISISKSKYNSSKHKVSASRALFEVSNSAPKLVPVTIVVKEPEYETSQEGENKGPPTFCGQTTVSEIRPLLKEWIASSPVPMEDDLQMMSDFFKDLICSWRIDSVQILLKCLCRNIGKLGSESDHTSMWREAWQRLVQKIQTVMIQNYGNPLYIPDSF